MNFTDPTQKDLKTEARLVPNSEGTVLYEEDDQLTQREPLLV